MACGHYCILLWLLIIRNDERCVNICRYICIVLSAYIVSPMVFIHGQCSISLWQTDRHCVNIVMLVVNMYVLLCVKIKYWIVIVFLFSKSEFAYTSYTFNKQKQVGYARRKHTRSRWCSLHSIQCIQSNVTWIVNAHIQINTRSQNLPM